MGYDTQFSMTVKNISQFELEKLNDVLKEKDIINYAFEEGVMYSCGNSAEFSCCDSVHWYSFEKDMIEISRMFPFAVFEVSGIGEEYGDFWREYFSNGNSELCQGEIVYEQPKFIQWEKASSF